MQAKPQTKSNIANKLQALFIISRPYVYPVPLLWGLTAIMLNKTIVFNYATPKFLVAFFFPLLGWTTAQMFDDLRDFHIDKINYPKRPLPSNMIPRSFVLKYILCVSLIGAVIVGLLEPIALLTVVFAILAGLFYPFSKRYGFLAGLVLGIAFFVIPLFSSLVYSGKIPLVIWFFALTILLIELSCNIIGAFQDIRGDKAMGIDTLPIKIGFSKSAVVSALFLILGVLTTLSMLWFYDIEFASLFFGLAIMILAIHIVLTLVLNSDINTSHQALKKVRFLSVLHAGFFMTLIAPFYIVLEIVVLAIAYNVVLTNVFEKAELGV